MDGIVGETVSVMYCRCRNSVRVSSPCVAMGLNFKLYALNPFRARQSLRERTDHPTAVNHDQMSGCAGTVQTNIVNANERTNERVNIQERGQGTGADSRPGREKENKGTWVHISGFSTQTSGQESPASQS